MRLRTPFWNDAERRPRAGWRLLAVTVLFALVAGLSFLVAGAVAPLVGAAGPATMTAPMLAVRGTAQLAGTLAMLGALAVAVDRRRLRDFGLRVDRAWWLDLGFGLALGAALQTGVFAVELAAGWLRVTGLLVTAPGAAFLPWLLAALAGYVAVGVYEELFARGYLLTNLAEGLDGPGGLGRRGAVAAATGASALVFGGLHAANPGATAASTAALAFAGVFLAVGYVLTGELAVPVGVHVTWNFFQGVVYGFPVSGASLGVSVVAVEQTGPRAVTGGAFGPEAGLIGVAAMAVGVAATAWWARYSRGDLRIAPELTRPELRWRE